MDTARFMKLPAGTARAGTTGEFSQESREGEGIMSIAAQTRTVRMQQAEQLRIIRMA